MLGTLPFRVKVCSRVPGGQAQRMLSTFVRGFRDDAPDLTFDFHFMTESEALSNPTRPWPSSYSIHPDKCGCSKAFLRMKAAYDQRNDKKEEQRNRKGRPRNEAKRLAQAVKPLSLRSAQKQSSCAKLCRRGKSRGQGHYAGSIIVIVAGNRRS